MEERTPGDPPGESIGRVLAPDGERREVRWDCRSSVIWVHVGGWRRCGRARCVEDALRAAEAALFMFLP